MKKRQRSRRDLQQNRVYKWESKFLKDVERWSTLRLLFETVQKDLNFPKFKLHYSSGVRLSYALGNNVYMIREHFCKAILLHEISHCITNQIYKDEITSHGKEWLTVYMCMLIRYVDMDTDLLISDVEANLLLFNKKVVKNYKNTLILW